MVMVLITMLTIMSVEVAETGESHYLITTSLRDTVKSRALAFSGVNAVGALLKFDAEQGKPKKEVDHLGDVWNLQPPLNSIALSDGTAQAFVEDEMSKFNAQEMSKEQFACLLKTLEMDMDVDVDNAYRWIEQWRESPKDKGDNLDDDPYSMRVPPILRSDAPFETVSELGLVEGICWKNLEKLRPFLTVYPRWQPPPPDPGSTNKPTPPRLNRSKVNVNTAKKEVLSCVAPESGFDRAVEEIIRLREEKPFESADQVKAVARGVSPDPTPYLTFSSHIYSVTSIGRVGAEGRETTVVVNAVIDRGSSSSKEMDFLYWREQ